MHCENLNEDKICELFHNNDQDAPKRDYDVSLNLTLTSRNTQQYQLQSDLLGSHNGTTLATKQIEKFNKWIEFFNNKNDKLMDDMSILVDNLSAQSSKNVLLSIPDFDLIKKKCRRGARKLLSSQDNTENLQCRECKKKDQLIEIINEEHHIKLEEVNELSQKLSKLSQLYQMEVKNALHEKLCRQIELNLMVESNKQLRNSISLMQSQLQRNKLEKSTLSVQKSNSLLKTKDIDRRLENSGKSGQIPNANLTSNSYFRHSFSNMKNSTNPTNPNDDTINGINSIIGFENNEPNFDDLYRYFEEESSFIKSKLSYLRSEQQRRTGKKKIPECSQKNLYQSYTQIMRSLIQIKYEKEKCAENKFSVYSNSNSNSGQRLNQRSRSNSNMSKLEITNGNSSNLSGTSNTIISSQEYKELKNNLKCCEIQLNNLKDTNDDLIEELKQMSMMCEMRNKDIQKMEHEYKMVTQKYLREYRQRKKMQLIIEQTKPNIRTYCRITPKFRNQDYHECPFAYNSKKVCLDNRQFEFDHVFSEYSKQEEVFLEARGALESLFQGKNLCILSHGQSKSRNNYTLHGSHQQPGFSSMMITQMFEMMERQKKDYQFEVKMSLVEIQRDNIRDLMKDFREVKSSAKIDLKEQKNGIYLSNSFIIKFTNPQDLLQAYYHALDYRKNHLQMPSDSLSHKILIIYLNVRNLKSKQEKVAKLSIVDLANPEKYSTSPSTLKYNQIINRTLSCLEQILAGLRSKKQNLPYLESKLTFLLKDSLTPSNKVFLFINISPSKMSQLETLNSLKFSASVKTKKNENELRKKKDSKQLNGSSISQYIVIPRRSSSRLSIS